MDVITSLQQDPIHGIIDSMNTETPRQESQKTCTRYLPCLQQGCMICSVSINHIHNLDLALNSSNAPPTSPTDPPTNQSNQEVADDLSPKIKTLQANLEIIQQFHDVEDLHSVALTQHLIQNIIEASPWK